MTLDSDTGEFSVIRFPALVELTRPRAKAKRGERKRNEIDPWARRAMITGGITFAVGLLASAVLAGMFSINPTTANIHRGFNPLSYLITLLGALALATGWLRTAGRKDNREDTASVMVEAECERRRREQGMKEKLEDLDERLDRLAELIPLAVDEAVRKARAAAAPDLRAALDEVIKRVKADAYGAAVQHLRAEFAAAQTNLDERMGRIEEALRAVTDPASNFMHYLAACDDLRREQEDGGGVANG